MRSVRNLSFFLSCFAGCLLALSPALQAATHTAAGLSLADVQAAVDAAADGDTVKLPAGTATWTACVKVAGKCITIEGVGADKTTIVVGTFPAGSTLHVLEINAKKGGLTRLCNLAIDGGSGPKDGDNKGMLTLRGDSTTWRIDHLRIRATRTCAMQVYASGGVIDHNMFELVGWTFGIYGFNGGRYYGDAAWADDTDLGSGSKPFFVEDNQFIATTQSCRLTAGKASASSSATLGSRMPRSRITARKPAAACARSFEIYENTLTFAARTAGCRRLPLRDGRGLSRTRLPASGTPFTATITATGKAFALGHRQRRKPL